MGISVEGQKCPVCGAYLFDNDDLVFCPECGAPHHRDCYEAIGHCAYKDKHGTSEGYMPPVKAEPKVEAEGPNQQQITKRCRFCGEELSLNEEVCHRCGRPQSAQQFGANVFVDPMGGVLPNEDIDGVVAEDLRRYVAVNTPRYLPRFKAMNQGKKRSWNWAAFLIPNVWFFYRKMYLPGVLFSLLLITVTLFLLPLSAVVSTFPQEALSSTVRLAQYLAQNIEKIGALPLILAALSGVLELVVRIVAGLTGDKLYKKSAVQNIKKIKESDTEDVPVELALARKGGVNPLMGIVGLLAVDFVLEWIAAFYTLL
ncbi:MAG: DUF2628 domain-containing protein [Clostridia bacterium]|nr:DUF2628 domain-containing protein [Clostridia bacterium]